MQRGFGDLLRNTRKKAGKSMLDVAQHLGVSVVFVSDVERGNRAPFTPDKILKVAELLEVDPEPLLQGCSRDSRKFRIRRNPGQQ